jgi:dihydroorotase
MSYDLVIEGRYVDPIRGVREGSIGIKEGRIAYISERPISGKRNIRLSESEIVFPGFIDTHVHFREPGWEHKGNIASESRAAAFGGVTTAMDMPNTPIPTISMERVLEKKQIGKRKSVIDLEFYGGVGPDNLDNLEEMTDHVPAFKVYMCETTGNLNFESLDQIEEAFSCLSGLGKPVAVHCEDIILNERAKEKYRDKFEQYGYLVHALSRPPESEDEAIKNALGFSRKYGVSLSVCHVSIKNGLVNIQRDDKAKSEVNLYHPLYDIEELETHGASRKMNPPLREREDVNYLMDSLVKGDVSFVGTDHAPHTLEEKGVKDFWAVPSGVPSVENYGSFVASLIKHLGMEPQTLAGVTSYNAAQFFGLKGKGRIKEGYLGDLVVLDINRPMKVKPLYKTKCGWSPFEGLEFPGGPTYTIRRGKIIMKRGRLLI